MTLPRGFKATAEREATRIRHEMGVSEGDPVNILSVAEHVQAIVVGADRLVAIERLEELERLQAYAFSAATFDVKGKSYIVTNPLRSRGRLASDVAHEIAHLLLQHDLTEIREIEGVPFRTCRPDEEEQATVFGGTLLLPRPLLLNAARRGLGPEQIAVAYGVTTEMARFRYTTTGVAKQVLRRPR
ncbi:MAG: ImmA/IrrE family metallo-endopeptidase [Actinobacteria bacterium]|nr:ImmA/IrrE family metallo-endopeptidase [Actinomycetota bacterium]MBI3686232.1 ImmA/IrrE family metallo-endopeptidase [Actinomycetota bacterium]